MVMARLVRQRQLHGNMHHDLGKPLTASVAAESLPHFVSDRMVS
jgi:hypothetical protein